MIPQPQLPELGRDLSSQRPQRSFGGGVSGSSKAVHAAAHDGGDLLGVHLMNSPYSASECQNDMEASVNNVDQSS